MIKDIKEGFEEIKSVLEWPLKWEDGVIFCGVRHCQERDFIGDHVMKLYNRLELSEVFDALSKHIREYEH